MRLLLILIISMSACIAGYCKIPGYFNEDPALDEQLSSLVKSLDLDKDFDVGSDGIEQISLAVVDLNQKSPVIAGVNAGNFIYPASVYKVYVAAEILQQAASGSLNLYENYIINRPNDVDKTKEISNDPRPLLYAGDIVTVNYLLDLMITRSDNTAANCLIDIADRKNINNMIKQHNWQGSEVTRKFLSRQNEDEGYREIRGTESCALHAVDFLYRIETNQLINPWVSMQLKTLLGRQLDKSKLAAGLPENVMIYHKTGWFSYWTNDIAIIDDGNVKYILAVFLPLKAAVANRKHRHLSKEIYKLMKERSHVR